MTCHIANDNAFSRDVQQPAEPCIARHDGKRSMGMRARLLIACALTAVVALLALVAWLNSADWRRLLLFGCIVGIAALGGRRVATAAASRRVDEAIGQAPEEPIA
jgi:hypothetical protein